jgi:pilus assembly protein Flp/PilA
MLKRFLKDETGLELTEYAVAAALITIAIATAITTLGGNISAKITSLANAVK